MSLLEAFESQLFFSYSFIFSIYYTLLEGFYSCVYIYELCKYTNQFELIQVHEFTMRTMCRAGDQVNFQYDLIIPQMDSIYKEGHSEGRWCRAFAQIHLE